MSFRKPERMPSIGAELANMRVRPATSQRLSGWKLSTLHDVLLYDSDCRSVRFAGVVFLNGSGATAGQRLMAGHRMHPLHAGQLRTESFTETHEHCDRSPPVMYMLRVSWALMK